MAFIYKIADLLPSCQVGMSRSAFAGDWENRIPALPFLRCSLWVTTSEFMRIVRGFYGVAAMPSCGLATAAPLSRPCLFSLFPLGHNARFVRIALEIACIAFALVTLPSLRNRRLLSTHLICSTIAMESTETPVSSAGRVTCVGIACFC